MTCKDCIHNDVCRGVYLAIQNNTKLTLKEFQILCEKENFDNQDIALYDCLFFQDRSRFVELPCHVGDTVYMLTKQTQKLGHKKVTKTVIVECCVDNFRIGDAGYPSAALCDSENVWCYGVEPKMFGEIIFLSREEAEQFLKERGSK